MIRCPKCGHDSVNVLIWGTASTKDFISHEVLNTEMDLKEHARCENESCEYEGWESEFKFYELACLSECTKHAYFRGGDNGTDKQSSNETAQ